MSLIYKVRIYTYSIEQAAGNGSHNLLTIVMNEKGVDLDGALYWLAKYNDEVLSKFQTQRHMLPSWDPSIVNEFVERLAFWIRGLDTVSPRLERTTGSWSFESRRYFGTKGPEIKEHIG